MFNSYVNVYQRVNPIQTHEIPMKSSIAIAAVQRLDGKSCWWIQLGNMVMDNSNFQGENMGDWYNVMPPSDVNVGLDSPQ
jgi:hypothetical protein